MERWQGRHGAMAGQAWSDGRLQAWSGGKLQAWSGGREARTAPDALPQTCASRSISHEVGS